MFCRVLRPQPATNERHDECTSCAVTQAGNHFLSGEDADQHAPRWDISSAHSAAVPAWVEICFMCNLSQWTLVTLVNADDEAAAWTAMPLGGWPSMRCGCNWGDAFKRRWGVLWHMKDHDEGCWRMMIINDDEDDDDVEGWRWRMRTSASWRSPCTVFLSHRGDPSCGRLDGKLLHRNGRVLTSVDHGQIETALTAGNWLILGWCYVQFCC